MVKWKCGAALAALMMAICAPGEAQTILPVNAPTTVDGVTSVCTGIGSDEDNHPEWKAFPLKIVVVGKQGQYLADADVTIAQGKKTVANVHCEAPWILVQLPAGRYRVTASHNGKTVTQTAVAAARGQGSVILRFSDAGGTVSPQHVEALKAGTAP